MMARLEVQPRDWRGVARTAAQRGGRARTGPGYMLEVLRASREGPMEDKCLGAFYGILFFNMAPKNKHNTA